MEQAFDPYHIWLGIPSEEQPPDHYRLLGLMPFESNPDAIQNAADRQMVHLRTFQTGKHSEYSQRLLNEVAAAKICLLNGAKKSAYDARLRESIARRPPSLPARRQEDDPPDAATTFLAEDSGARYQHPYAGLCKERTRNSRVAMMAGASAAVVLAALAIYYLQSASGEKRTYSLQAAAGKRAEESSNDRGPNRTDAAPAVASNSLPSTPKPPDTPVAPPVEKAGPAASEPRDPPPAEPENPPPTGPETQPPIELEVQPPLKPAEPPPDDKEYTPREHEPPSKPPVEYYVQGGRLLPVPGEEEQERAMVLARNLFADELFKAETAEEKNAAAKKILRRANELARDPVGAFVLYQLACETAIQAVDCETAFQAADDMAGRYRIDVVEKKTAVLKELAKKARTPADHASLAARALDVMECAVGGDKCAQAVEAGEFALTEAGKSRDKELLAAVRPRVYEVRKTAQKFAEFEATRSVLADKPDDPKANRTAGEFLCFFKENWDLGLHYLAKGDDAELTALARRELKSPAATAEQVKLADDWWDYAQKAKAPIKQAVLLHAGLWYEKAQGKAVGLVKATIEKRLAEVAEIASQKSLAGDPLRSAALNADVLIELSAESAEFRRASENSRIGLRSHYGDVNIPHIENWHNPQDCVLWNKVKFPKRGVYEVSARIATIHGGSELVVGIGDGYGVCGTIPNTDGYGNFRTIVLGTIKIERPGEHQIFVGPFPPKMSTWKPINLAGITLKYVSPSNASAPSKRGRRKPVPGKITATCDDKFELCVNGAIVIAGKNYHDVPSAIHQFAKGDVITVKCVDLGGEKGFTCAIQFQKHPPIVSGDGWRAYMPKDPMKKWYDPENIGRTFPVSRGNSYSEDDLQKACGVAAMEIWGGENTCYLFYVIP